MQKMQKCTYYTSNIDYSIFSFRWYWILNMSSYHGFETCMHFLSWTLCLCNQYSVVYMLWKWISRSSCAVRAQSHAYTCTWWRTPVRGDGHTRTCDDARYLALSLLSMQPCGWPRSPKKGVLALPRCSHVTHVIFSLWLRTFVSARTMHHYANQIIKIISLLVN